MAAMILREPLDVPAFLLQLGAGKLAPRRNAAVRVILANRDDDQFLCNRRSCQREGCAAPCGGHRPAEGLPGGPARSYVPPTTPSKSRAGDSEAGPVWRGPFSTVSVPPTDQLGAHP